MASNKDKAFALFYTTAAAVATVTATAVIVVIPTNQATKQATKQPSRHRKHSNLGDYLGFSSGKGKRKPGWLAEGSQ